MTIYSENAVPILFRGDNQTIGLSAKANAEVEKAAAAALAAVEDGGSDALAEHLLVGEAVVLHNPDAAPDAPVRYVSFSIGGSSLQEALTEVIGAFDQSHVGDAGVAMQDHLHKPEWVASTHERLAALLADYYSAQVRDISEVL